MKLCSHEELTRSNINTAYYKKEKYVMSNEAGNNNFIHVL